MGLGPGAVGLCGLDQAVMMGTGADVGATEEKMLFADANRPDPVRRQFVVDSKPTIT